MSITLAINTENKVKEESIHVHKVVQMQGCSYENLYRKYGPIGGPYIDSKGFISVSLITDKKR